MTVTILVLIRKTDQGRRCAITGKATDAACQSVHGVLALTPSKPLLVVQKEYGSTAYEGLHKVDDVVEIARLILDPDLSDHQATHDEALRTRAWGIHEPVSRNGVMYLKILFTVLLPPVLGRLLGVWANAGFNRKILMHISKKGDTPACSGAGGLALSLSVWSRLTEIRYLRACSRRRLRRSLSSLA